MTTSISLVIDSSVAVKWLTIKNESNFEEADRILKDFESGKIRIFMPELSKYEVGNTLLKKGLTANNIKTALKEFYRLPIEFIPETAYSASLSAEFAYKYKISYYDASFITLAKQLEVGLITENTKHQGRYKGKDIKVIPLKNYK